MMNAYDYDLLLRAQRVLGSMFDTSLNFYAVELKDFYHMFINSSISVKFAMGDRWFGIDGC